MAGEIRRLQPSIYAFVDGNHNGGVGIVIVVQRQDGRSIKEISTTVWQVFADAGLNMLASKAAITEALARIRNILGELAALYGAIGEVDESSEVTIVHDYKGLDAWITGKWRINDPVVAEVVAACRKKIEARGLQVKFLHQPAHQSTFAIADEFVKFNSIADKLATRAAYPAEVRVRED